MSAPDWVRRWRAAFGRPPTPPEPTADPVQIRFSGIEQMLARFEVRIAALERKVAGITRAPDPPQPQPVRGDDRAPAITSGRKPPTFGGA
jgi:hypothetical protein